MFQCCLGSGLGTIGDFSPEQLLHDPYYSARNVSSVMLAYRAEVDHTDFAFLIFPTNCRKTWWLSKTRHHKWFPLEITSEERAQKFHADDVWLPKSGWCLSLISWRKLPSLHGLFIIYFCLAYCHTLCCGNQPGRATTRRKAVKDLLFHCSSHSESISEIKRNKRVL